MRFLFTLILVSIFILPYAKAQDTLPGFTASLKSTGKVLISWRNGYPSVNQISIQRSNDSLRNFTTILTVPDPQIPENGVVDSKPGSSKMYYRSLILFPNSKYMFTKSRRPVLERVEQPSVSTKQVHTGKQKMAQGQSKQKQVVPVAPGTQSAVAEKGQSAAVANSPNISKTDPATAVVKSVEEEEKYLILPKIDNSRIYYMMDNSSMKKPSVTNPGKIKSPTIAEKILFVKRRDSVIMQLEGNQVRRFSDSLVKQTMDTLYFVNAEPYRSSLLLRFIKNPKKFIKFLPMYLQPRTAIFLSLCRIARRKNISLLFLSLTIHR
jgi:hypothetical protein